MTTIFDDPQMPPVGEKISLPDGELVYFAAWCEADHATVWQRGLEDRIVWQQETLRIHGRNVLTPRLVAWHGDADAHYRYSGVQHTPQRWTPLLSEIAAAVADSAGTKFNSVLLNRYRHGADSMGWHADDESELGSNPIIASLSLGETRRFKLRHKRTRTVFNLDLGHGDLLVMRGPTQNHWQHALPKTRKTIGERINLTFRHIVGHRQSRPMTVLAP